MPGRIKKILLVTVGVVVLWMAGRQTAKWAEIKKTIQENVSAEEGGIPSRDQNTGENGADIIPGADSRGPGDSQIFPEEKNTDGQTEAEKKIALTFDDGPHPTYTEELLDGLKERGVKASFFVLGEHAQLHPELIKRMREEGHLVGNHTYSHIQLKDGNWEEYRQELIRTNEVLREITGEETAYVRPPYGSWDKSFEEELNMFPVLWTVDSRDWCTGNAAEVAQKVERETEEGDIILMHDYYATSVEAALAAVDALLAEGYAFVTVEEILFD